jgi:hypothetical protein
VYEKMALEQKKIKINDKENYEIIIRRRTRMEKLRRQKNMPNYRN